MKNLHAFRLKEKGLRRYFAKYSIRGDYSKRIETQLEIAIRRKVSPGFSLHFGNNGSETPVDVIISFYWLAFLWGLNFPGLGRFCEKIGRGHKRNISLKFHGRMMWWELWYDDDMGYDDYHRCDKRRKPRLWPWSMGREKYRSWMCLRQGNIDLNPLDALWGQRYYSYLDLWAKNTRLDVGQFEGDVYDVVFKLQKVTRARKHGPAWARRVSDEGWSADWRCEKGIPFRNDSWKGDEILASAEKVTQHCDGDLSDDWLFEAKASLVERVKKDRIKYNYSPPRKLVHVTRLTSGMPVCKSPDEADFVTADYASPGPMCQECVAIIKKGFTPPGVTEEIE